MALKTGVALIVAFLYTIFSVMISLCSYYAEASIKGKKETKVFFRSFTALNIPLIVIFAAIYFID